MSMSPNVIMIFVILALAVLWVWILVCLAILWKNDSELFKVAYVSIKNVEPIDIRDQNTEQEGSWDFRCKIPGGSNIK